MLSFTVPTNESSGTYEIVLNTEEDGADRLRIPVHVLARPRVSAQWIEEQQLVRAGERIEASLRVTNSGNTATLWRIEARSSLGLPHSVRPRSLELAPGESGSVRLQVTTNEDITSALTHALSIQVTSGGGVQGATLSMMTNIYPSRVAERTRNEDRMPALLTATAATEDGEVSGQVELRIPESVIENRTLEALFRVPDARQVSTFSQPDRYSIRLGSPKGSLWLGDQTWQATELLDAGSLGFGAGGDIERGRVLGGGYIQRSRRIFPEQQQAFVFVGMKPREGLEIRLNGLAKRTFEEGESASLGVVYQPGNQLMQAELAQGWFDGKTGRAAQFSMALQRRNTTFSARGEAADDAFFGAIRGARGGSVSSQASLAPWLRVSGQTRFHQRRYDLRAGDRAEQTFGLARSVLTMLRTRDRYRVSWSVALQGQLNDNNLTSLRREERSIESRMTLNRRRMGTSLRLRHGQSQDAAVAELPHYVTAQATLFGSRGAWSINLSGTVLDGPTFYNPVAQERVSVGANLGWDKGRGTQVVLSGLHSEDRLRSEQSFSMADLRLKQRLVSGHELTLRARTVQTAFTDAVRNASVSFAWTVPLDLPIPGMRSARTQLTGRVVDSETGEAVAGASIQMGDQRTVTDGDGRFVLRSLPGGTAYLAVDRASIGYERRPIPSMPMAIDLAEVLAGGIQIDIIRAADVKLHVDVDTGMGSGRQSALNTSLDQNDRAGILIEISSPFGRLRRVTDREGVVRFADLVPGSWKAFIVGTALPEGSISRPDTLPLEAGPGQEAEGTLTIVPERREVRLVGSGGITLSGGVRPVESVSISLGRQEDERTNAAGDSVDDAAEPGREALLADAEPTPGLQTYKVREGDSLARLARHFYQGSTVHWIRLWKANRDQIPDPNLITPGTALVVPPGGALTREEKAALERWAESVR